MRVVEPAPSQQIRPSSPSQELLYGSIGLSLKIGLSLVAVVSLVRLAGAYQERLDRDGTLAPTIGMFVATRIKPQARVFAESRGVARRRR